MRKRTVLGGFALIAAGCVNLNPYSQPVKVEAGPQPSHSQLEPAIKEVLLPRLKDPDSMKQFRIINVMKTRWFLGAPISNPGAAEGWIACFEYNAKNSYGAYPGTSIEGYVFRMEGNQARFIMTQDGAIMGPRCSGPPHY